MPVQKLFSYPYNTYLMIRREFAVYCQQEDLETKLLRVIEQYVENGRTQLFQQEANRSKTPIDKIEIPRDIWVPISYNLFRSEINDATISDNTLKAAIRSLEKKKLIQKDYAPKRRYDPPTYRLQVHVIDVLNDTLRISGGQKLIPSKIDTLKNLPPQFLTPEILSSNEKLRVSKIDTNNNKGNVTKERVCITPTIPDPQPDTHPSLSHENVSHTEPASEHLSTGKVVTANTRASVAGPTGPMPILPLPALGLDTDVSLTTPVSSEALDEKKRFGKMAETIKRLTGIQFVPLDALRFLDAWGNTEYGPCSLSRWEVSAAMDIVDRLKGTLKDALLIADDLKAKEKTVKIETVYNSWHTLPDLKKARKQKNTQPRATVFTTEDLRKSAWEA